MLFLDTVFWGGGRCDRSSVRAERSCAVPSTPHMNMTRGQGRLPGGDVMAYLHPGLRDAFRWDRGVAPTSWKTLSDDIWLKRGPVTINRFLHGASAQLPGGVVAKAALPRQAGGGSRVPRGLGASRQDRGGLSMLGISLERPRHGGTAPAPGVRRDMGASGRPPVTAVGGQAPRVWEAKAPPSVPRAQEQRRPKLWERTWRDSSPDL